MSARTIIAYPDAIYLRPAERIVDFDSSLAELAADLTETLEKVSALGLTAQHIGVASAITVIRTDAAGPALSFINPVLTWQSPTLARHPEGSVAMPGLVEEVERPASVRVRYQSLDGSLHEEEHIGLMAVCLQHEIDQIEGIFWLKRLSRLKRDRLLKRHGKGS